MKMRSRRDRLLTPIFLDFPCGSSGKESACKAGDLGSIPGKGRCLGERKGCPLQYSGLDNSMGCIVHGSQRVRNGLATINFTYFHILTLLYFKLAKCSFLSNLLALTLVSGVVLAHSELSVMFVHQNKCLLHLS